MRWERSWRRSGLSSVSDGIIATYVQMRQADVARTIEVTESVMIDVDSSNAIIGIEVIGGVDWASALMKLAVVGRLVVTPG
jgi:uncharacterized protein YuzE